MGGQSSFKTRPQMAAIAVDSCSARGEHGRPEARPSPPAGVQVPEAELLLPEPERSGWPAAGSNRRVPRALPPPTRRPGLSLETLRLAR
jgi:hypothetical protein